MKTVTSIDDYSVLGYTQYDKERKEKRDMQIREINGQSKSICDKSPQEKEFDKMLKTGSFGTTEIEGVVLKR